MTSLAPAPVAAGQLTLPRPLVCPLTRRPVEVVVGSGGHWVLQVRGAEHSFAYDPAGFPNFTREFLDAGSRRLWRIEGKESFRGNGDSSRRRALIDWYDEIILRLSKVDRSQPAGDDQEFYNAFFQEKDLVQFLHDYRNVLRRHEILRSIPAKRPLRLIDLGCGTGHLLWAFRDNGLDLFGMEYAPSALKLARRCAPDALLFNGDMTRLPLESDYFDVATSLEVCEHIQHDITAMAEAWRILKPGGLFIMSVPGNRHSEMYRRLIGHHRHYTSVKLRESLLVAGFKSVEPLRHYPHFHRQYSLIWPWVSAADRLIRMFLRGRETIYEARMGGVEIYRRLVLRHVSAIRRDRASGRNRLGDSTFVKAIK